MKRFIYAKRTDGAEGMINLEEVWYVAFRDHPETPQLYFKFGHDEVFTVHPDMAKGVWDTVRSLEGTMFQS